MDVKKYNRIKIWSAILSNGIFITTIIIMLITGFVNFLENTIREYVNSDFLVFTTFVLVLSLLTSIVTFPINFYSGYIIEHKYQLSNQTLLKYFIDKIKSLFISLIIGVPILFLFYYLIINFPETWWLFFSIAMFIITVVLAQIFPILIFPLFFKLKPIEDEELIEQVKDLAEKSNFKFSRIYLFDLSSKTKKANAALTGIGKTKKIILGDTLLNILSIEEIKTVLAHEIGHYKLKHIPKNLLLSTLQSFIIFYLISILYKHSLNYFGFHAISQISAFPLLIIWGFIIGLIVTPITNIISRKFEYEADTFAVRFTNMPEVFKSALTKLFEKNLSDKEPHPFVEWYFYSHPSYKKRIANIDKYSSYNENLEEL